MRSRANMVLFFVVMASAGIGILVSAKCDIFFNGHEIVLLCRKCNNLVPVCVWSPMYTGETAARESSVSTIIFNFVSIFI